MPLRDTTQRQSTCQVCPRLWVLVLSSSQKYACLLLSLSMAVHRSLGTSVTIHGSNSHLPAKPHFSFEGSVNHSIQRGTSSALLQVWLRHKHYLTFLHLTQNVPGTYNMLTWSSRNWAFSATLHWECFGRRSQDLEWIQVVHIHGACMSNDWSNRMRPVSCLCAVVHIILLP